MNKYLLLIVLMTPFLAISSEIDSLYTKSCIINGWSLEDDVNKAGETIVKALKEQLKCSEASYKMAVEKNGLFSNFTLGDISYALSIKAEECEDIVAINIQEIDCRDGFSPYNDLGKRDILLDYMTLSSEGTLLIKY